MRIPVRHGTAVWLMAISGFEGPQPLHCPQRIHRLEQPLVGGDELQRQGIPKHIYVYHMPKRGGMYWERPCLRAGRCSCRGGPRRPRERPAGPPAPTSAAGPRIGQGLEIIGEGVVMRQRNRGDGSPLTLPALNVGISRPRFC